MPCVQPSNPEATATDTTSKLDLRRARITEEKSIVCEII
jgi:hypothetical protein